MFLGTSKQPEAKRNDQPRQPILIEDSDEEEIDLEKLGLPVFPIVDIPPITPHYNLFFAMDAILAIDGNNKKDVRDSLIRKGFFINEVFYRKQFTQLMFRRLCIAPDMAPLFAELYCELGKADMKDGKSEFLSELFKYLMTSADDTSPPTKLQETRMLHMVHMSFMGYIYQHMDKDEVCEKMIPALDAVIDHYLLQALITADKRMYEYSMRLVWELGDLLIKRDAACRYAGEMMLRLIQFPKEKVAQRGLTGMVSRYISVLRESPNLCSRTCVRPDIVTESFTSPFEFFTDKIQIPESENYLIYNSKLMQIFAPHFDQFFKQLCHKGYNEDVYNTLRQILQMLFHIPSEEYEEEACKETFESAFKFVSACDYFRINVPYDFLDEHLLWAFVNCDHTDRKQLPDKLGKLLSQVLEFISIDRSKQLLNDGKVGGLEFTREEKDILRVNISMKRGTDRRRIPEKFDVKWHMSDAVISVQKKQLHINKTFMSVFSPYFRDKFFLSPYQEDVDLEVTAEYDAFLIALQYLHHLNSDPIKVDLMDPDKTLPMLKKLWKVATTYQLRPVAVYCQSKVEKLKPYKAWKVASGMKMSMIMRKAVDRLSFVDLKRVFVEDKGMNIECPELQKTFLHKIYKIDNWETYLQITDKYAVMGTLAKVVKFLASKAMNLNEGMWISCMREDGPIYVVKCNPKHTIEQLRGVFLIEPKIVKMNGVELNPKNTLAQCGIVHGTTVEIFI